MCLLLSHLLIQQFALLDNVIITPHIGGSTEEAILAMGIAAINGLENNHFT
jgi:phosphoglycerate dehydrogenase-like enzyme